MPSSKSEPSLDRSNVASLLSLPPELLLQIITPLPVPIIANLRLVSHIFADLGAPELFKDGFKLYPLRDEMERLRAVSKHTEIAKGVQHLKIFTGAVDVSQLQTAVGTALQNAEIRISRADAMAIERIYEDLISTGCSKETDYCEERPLARIFAQLPNLISIQLTSEEDPFPYKRDPVTRKLISLPAKHMLGHIYDNLIDGTEALSGYNNGGFLDMDMAIWRCSNVLQASLQLPARIQRLAFDTFPIDCLLLNDSMEMVDDGKVQAMTTAMAEVRDLKITFIGRCSLDFEYTNLAHARTLGALIGSMQQLRNLDLEWAVEDDMSPGFEEAWEESMFSNSIPHLESLRFIDTERQEKYITAFLIRHKKTLKRLHFGYECFYIEADLENGQDKEDLRSWKDVFSEYRQHLTKLEKFEFMTDNDISLYSREDWEVLPISKDAPVPIEKLIELYVLGKIPWPMVGNNPRVRGWKPKFMGTHLGFLDLSPEDLENFLGDEWETEGDSSSSDIDMEESDESDDSDDSNDSNDSDDSEHHHHYIVNHELTDEDMDPGDQEGFMPNDGWYDI